MERTDVVVIGAGLMGSAAARSLGARGVDTILLEQFRAGHTRGSSHWMAQHPLPDPTAWANIENPDERLPVALGELYEWYEQGEYMLANVTRDLALVPALRPSMEAFQRWLDAAADALVGGRPEGGARRRRKRAAVGHALAFETWRSLVGHQGMSRSEAIELMKALAAAAGRA